MTFPRTPEEYKQYLNERLNWFERLTAGATSLDERADVTNLLLIELLRVGSEGLIDLSRSIASIIAALGGQAPGLGNPETFSTGQVVVTTAGIPVQLPDMPVPAGHKAIIAAKPDNAGDILFAPSEQGAKPTSTTRFDRLEPGDSFPFPIANLEEIWLDADNSGDGISWYVPRMKK